MFDGPEPIYQQIAQYLRAQVLSGEIAEEERVMSTTEFATTFRINPATAAKAFALLSEEEIVYKRRGLGMFVSPGARERLLAQHRGDYFTKVLDPAIREALLLGIPAEDLITHIRHHGPGATPPDAPTATAPTTTDTQR